MSSVLATASPPIATISSTTSWAGPWSLPSPSMEPPRSLTTTLAPWCARSRACSRPMPRPAPVTIATRPSFSLLMAASTPLVFPRSRHLPDRPPSSARSPEGGKSARQAPPDALVGPIPQVPAKRARVVPPWIRRTPGRQRTRLGPRPAMAVPPPSARRRPRRSTRSTRSTRSAADVGCCRPARAPRGARRPGHRLGRRHELGWGGPQRPPGRHGREPPVRDAAGREGGGAGHRPTPPCRWRSMVRPATAGRADPHVPHHRR